MNSLVFFVAAWFEEASMLVSRRLVVFSLSYLSLTARNCS